MLAYYFPFYDYYYIFGRVCLFSSFYSFHLFVSVLRLCVLLVLHPLCTYET